MKKIYFVCLLAFFMVSRASSQTYTFMDEGGQLSTNPASNVLIEVLPHTAKTKVDARGYLSIGGKGQESFQRITLTDRYAEVSNSGTPGSLRPFCCS